MITTVVFDLDDTLFDEMDFCRSGFRAAAQHLATLSDTRTPDDIFAVIWKCFVTGSRGSTFDLALAELGLPRDVRVIHKLVEIYRSHTPALTLPDESRATLDALKDKYTLALLTDGFLPTQRLKVQALGIEHYFKAIIYTEELGREYWKPSPRGFEILVEMLKTRPQEMVYVADNEAKDFIAPNRLGLWTIQLVRPCGLHGQPSGLPDAAARMKIDRMGKLPEVLSRL